MNNVLDLPAHSFQQALDLPPEVLARLLHKELTRLAALLDGLPDLDQTEVIQIPAGTAYRLMALGTAALKSLTAARPAGSD